MIKVSLIMPIYNAELFVKKSISSILNQTYADFELILVDDGSTDCSGAICDEFAQKDNRIRVIHKQNEGLICARIAGIEEANGEWIAFVDADDWVEDCFLERLIDSADHERTDIVISGCIVETGKRSDTVNNMVLSGIYEGTEVESVFIPKMLCWEGFYQFGVLPYMWNKLFRRELLKKCYKEIDTRIYDGEDVAVVYPYLLYAKKIIVIEDCMYHYRIHENSMTYKKRKDYYENVSRLYLHLDKQFKASEYYDLMLPQLDQYMRMMIWNGVPEDTRDKDREFLFSFGKIPGGSDIILYGAGFVGAKYYQQVKKTNYCNIVSWVDRNFLHLAERGIPVESPDVITEKKYDYVVIANAGVEIREEIRKYLLRLGVEEQRIVMGEENAHCRVKQAIREDSK